MLDCRLEITEYVKQVAKVAQMRSLAGGQSGLFRELQPFLGMFKCGTEIRAHDPHAQQDVFCNRFKPQVWSIQKHSLAQSRMPKCAPEESSLGLHFTHVDVYGRGD